MRIGKYTNFIHQNVVPEGVEKIGVYNESGERVGSIPLSHLARPALGEPLYSFGAISDVHIGYGDAKEDFIRILGYMADRVDFVCVSGDISGEGTDTQFEQYKGYADSYAGNTPVYAITGNHDVRVADVSSRFLQRVGYPMYYTVSSQPSTTLAAGCNIHNASVGDDVYIMLGEFGATEGGVFTIAELQWLYQTLERNRNCRCFVFFHVRPQDGCGNPWGIYSYDIWGGTEATVFESLMRHYKNALFFHGHSHIEYALQTKDNLANYDDIYGCHSIHVSSAYAPRTGDETGATSRVDLPGESEGYVVDVYANHVMLQARDFVRSEWIPLAQYCLDTTLQFVAAGTYSDSTGTIITQ